MSVVIIGNGGGVRNAITAMENASLSWTTAQRSQAEKILDDAKKRIEAFTAAPQPPA